MAQLPEVCGEVSVLEPETHRSETLCEVSPDAKVSVKLVASSGIGTIAAGVAKAGPCCLAHPLSSFSSARAAASSWGKSEQG